MHAKGSRRIVAGLTVGLGLGASMPTANAELDMAQVPLFLEEAVSPRVMLALSRDHEMFKEAYPDHSDLNGDGTINRTYTDSFEYYGYFDSNWCYTHNGSEFVPDAPAGGSTGHHCGSSGQWSGNFLNWATMTRIDIVRRVLYGGRRVVDEDDRTVLQRELIPTSAHAFVKVHESTNLGLHIPPEMAAASGGSISICNVTYRTSGSSHTVGDVPSSMRIAAGRWDVWAASEITQCGWRHQQSVNLARPFHPDESAHRLGVLDVRVEVCTSQMDHPARCKRYPSGYRKPVGLLQQYGEGGRVHFGLITGSYARNKSGGVLRRNIGPLTGNADELENEIHPSSGRFANQTDGTPGIVNTIDRLRISHWDFAASQFSGDNCSAPGILSFPDGDCSNWGNPVGEIVFEALRYYANAGNAVFDANDTTYIPGIPRVQSSNWRDPLPADQFCANPNLVVMSSGTTSFDSSRSVYSTSGVPNLSLDARMSEISSAEGVSGPHIIGGSDGMCTAEGISGLAGARGICPEAPSLEGGYFAAGLTYHAWTRDLRPEYDGSQHVRTFAVNLAEPLPRLQFGDITLLPACQANSNANAGHSSSGWRACSLIQFDVLEEPEYQNGQMVHGRFRAYWEDSTWGSDYDMDGVTELTICRGARCGGTVQPNQVQVRTEAVQAFAGHALRFGFTATGAVEDGVHLPILRPGNQNFSVVAPLSVNPPDPPNRYVDVRTLTAGGSGAGLLNDPLWYAAKWGGFDKDGGNTPSSVDQWDTNGDGNPDNYYLARNPGQLEADLDQVFSDITAAVSSASAIATNSTQLSTETILYQARFNTEDWTGELLAYGIEPDGSVGGLLWDAGERIPAEHNRRIFTVNADGEGIAFEWSELDEAQQIALARNPRTGAQDSLGVDRLEWLRGVRDTEQAFGGELRNRSRVLGDIVNSNPQFVGSLNFGYEGLPAAHAPRGPSVTDGFETNRYDEFRRNQLDSNGRPLRPTVYVGANDGMLHAFDAETGDERFAYVPGALFEDLNRLPDPDYVHRYYVDGQIFVGHAFIERDGVSSWRTILVGTLGAGGKAVYALDVTDPSSFSEDDVLWEITNETPGFENLGHILTQPVIAPLPGGHWAAVFGNGYNGASQQSSLFVVDLATGEPIRSEITTGAGGSGAPNGLSAVTLLPGGNRVVQTAYGGDLLGNLWKFDLSHQSNENQWGVAFTAGGNPAPLFVARGPEGADDRQPITAAPDLGRHPQNGVMVYFGTGKYFETDDNIVGADPQVQTFYGIWDDGSRLSATAGRDTLLHRQEILVEEVHFGREVRVTSDTPPDWSSDRGWYLDLVSPNHGREGERVVSRPTLSAGRIIFTTTIPSPSPCDAGGSSWLMEMEAVTGSRLSYSPLDLNNDGVVDDDDMVSVILPDGTEVTVPVSGVRSREGIIQTPTIISAGEVEYKLASGTSGEVEVFRERGGINRARGSWRQLR